MSITPKPVRPSRKPGREQSNRGIKSTEATENPSNGASRETQGSEDHGGINETNEKEDVRVSALSMQVQTVQDAAALAIRVACENGCDQDGKRHNLTFIFARALKAWEKFHQRPLPASERQSAFNVWWAAANNARLLTVEDDPEEWFFQFSDHCSRAKYALGANPLRVAEERAEQGPVPKAAMAFTSPKIRKLVAVCFHLQQIQGDAPFYVSCRSVANLVGVTPGRALAFLNGLVAGGTLQLVEKGPPGGNRASRYRMPSAL